MNKKLMFVATRQFWPIPSTGKETTLYYDCKGLHDVCKYDIYLCCFTDKNTNKKASLPEFIKEVIYIDPPSKSIKIKNILTKSIFTRKWPLQNSMFYCDSNAKLLKQYYQKITPDLLIIDMVRLSNYIDVFKDETIKKIFIEEDMLSKRYRRQAEAETVGNVAGYYSANMPKVITKISNFGFVKKSILNYEASLIDKYEDCLPSKFDYITFISPIETEEFNKKYKTNKAVTLTMGANVKYCSEGEILPQKHRTMSIVGNFNYAPNRASIEWIDKNIMPFLPKDVIYYVIGKYPESLPSRLNSKNIKLLGFVDDFRPIVKSTDIYFSPICYGTGIKTKVVEGMAMGLPVITNSVGAEGLNVHNNVELIIEDNPDKMVKTILELFNNQERCNKIAECGKKFVLENHDWNNVYKTFEKMNL